MECGARGLTSQQFLSFLPSFLQPSRNTSYIHILCVCAHALYVTAYSSAEEKIPADRCQDVSMCVLADQVQPPQ